MQHALAFGRLFFALDLGRQRHLSAVDRQLDVLLLHARQFGMHEVGAIPFSDVHLDAGNRLEALAPVRIRDRAHQEALEQVVDQVAEVVRARVETSNVNHDRSPVFIESGA